MFHICGHKDCKSIYTKQTVGEILASDDPRHGMFYFIEGTNLELTINGKTYKFPPDKRIIKGLHTKIQEIRKATDKNDQADNED